MPFRRLYLILSLALSGAAMPALADGTVSPAFERRATEAVIWGMPAVNYDIMRQEMLDTTAGRPNQVLYWGKPLDWKNQTLTPNPDTIYLMTFFDAKDGPIVFEVPPADTGALNGNIVTVWQMPLEDVGRSGVDEGAGGKFAFVPPGWNGDLPAGITPLQSDTPEGYALFRSNLKSHSAEDVAAAIAYAKRIKVYPLSEAAAPPETVFTDAQDVFFDATIRYDDTFFEHLNRIVQTQPWLDRDRVMIDQLKSIGIEKGKPFRPNAGQRIALNAAAVDARAELAAAYDKGWELFYEGAGWRAAAPAEVVKSSQAGFTVPDAYPTDLRGMTYSFAYIGIKRLGTGQFYLVGISDKYGAPLDGAQTYRLRVPADAPVDQYWSVTAYDRETHALIKHMDRASRSSQAADLLKNADGSVDIYFGPTAPEGQTSNWVPTDPDRAFELMVRFYGPTKALFDRVWTLPDPEKVN